MKINGQTVGFETMEEGCWITNPTYDGSYRFKVNPVHEYGLEFINSPFYPQTVSEPQAHDDALMYVLRCIENKYIDNDATYTFVAFMGNIQLDVKNCKNSTFCNALLNVTNSIISSYVHDWEHLDNSDTDISDECEESDNDYYGEDTTATIHKTTKVIPLNEFALTTLKEAREIALAYLKNNKLTMTPLDRSETRKTIAKLNDLIGDRPEVKLTERKQNVLLKLLDKTITDYKHSNGKSMPYNDFKELEPLWMWAAQQSPVDNDEDEEDEE